LKIRERWSKMKYELNKPYFLKYTYNCGSDRCSTNFVLFTRAEIVQCAPGRTQPRYFGVRCTKNGNTNIDKKEYNWTETFLNNIGVLSMGEFLLTEIERKKAKIEGLKEKIEKAEKQIKSLTDQMP